MLNLRGAASEPTDYGFSGVVVERDPSNHENPGEATAEEAAMESIVPECALAWVGFVTGLAVQNLVTKAAGRSLPIRELKNLSNIFVPAAYIAESIRI